MILRFVPLLALLVVTGGATACAGISTASSAFDEGVSPPQPSGAADGGASSGVLVPTDAGSTPVGDDYNNNPLCGVRKSGTGGEGQCHPWDTNQADASTPPNESCPSLLHVDGGGDYACHVMAADGGAEPTCLPEGTSTGACGAQKSCKAGYECVVDGETGACRRYCCEPTACDAMSFCDVQPIVSGGGMVPVCVPVSSCTLLGVGQCSGRTCGVVDQTKGTTSCMDVGPRIEGEECETEHCARDLVCLGAPGARKCFKLCDTTNEAPAYSCRLDQKCLTNGVTFKGANVGVCTP
jgi:hypothetical protein